MPSESFGPRAAQYVGRRKKRFVLAFLLLGLWCLRDMLLTAVVKRQLRQVPQVDIGFSSLRLSLVPGSLTVKDLSVDQSPMPEAGGLAAKGLPLARVDELVVSWRYGALIDKTVAGSAKLSGVTASLWRVTTKRRASALGKAATAQNPQGRITQTELMPDPPPPETISAAWPQIARLALPISIDSVEIQGAKLIWHDTTVLPRLDYEVGGIEGTATNLTNREGLADGQYGRVTAKAAPAGGRLVINMEIDPLAKAPTFSMRGSLDGLQLPATNRVLQAYAKLDTEAGSLDTRFAFKCERGRYVGHIEPYLKGLQIKAQSDRAEQNTWLNRLYRKTAQAVGSLLKDNASDAIASRVPLSGEFADPDIGVAAAVGSLLSNAFWQALTPDELGTAQGRLRPKQPPSRQQGAKAGANEVPVNKKAPPKAPQRGAGGNKARPGKVP